MLLESYLTNRLSIKTRVIASSLIFAVFTQGILSLLHEIDWDYIRPYELLILTLKEGLPSIPIILNLSLVIAWIGLKQDLYLKKEVHALWLSGWQSLSTLKILIKGLLKITFINITLLFIIAPCIRTLGPTKNTDWIHALSGQNIKHSFAIPASDTKVLIGQGISNKTIERPFFIEFDTQWNIFQGQSAEVQKDSIAILDLKNISSSDNLQYLSINHMNIPILESEPPIAKEFLSFPELFCESRPKYKGEIIWRVALILLPWISLLPFRSLSPALQYRKETSGLSEQGKCLAWFSGWLILSFLGSKLPVILQ